ncbi:uncharacterized protein LOC126736640 [Anthonomus grandis grandis]|uniref:uncharacterized protein LOC126736640 n=1 Tax=Anthonomus grandis grandis TaxID=2921223 RepID=UPI002165577A|nr:uncharacterized protein LOC126736640 [Anthonomus grandis grandis]XP_050297057.1 uncharacterized protein LOC126736640 [Anthonomus grandis grandis]
MENESMDFSSVPAEPPDLDLIESHINSLNLKESSEFLNHIQSICAAVHQFELATVESNILSRILPIIHDRIEQNFSKNLSIFEIIDDTVSIKNSLQEVFQLTEAIQEISNFILGQSSINIGNIQSLADFLPKYIQLFATHYNSSNEYKDTYLDELSNIIVVLKHFYTSFLYILGSSLSLEEDEHDIKLLAEVILALCHMPNIWQPLDKSVIFSTWKCLGAIITKYSSLLANHLDVNIPIRLLTTNVCQILEQFAKEDPDYQFEIKKVTFLLKVVFKVWTFEFYEKISSFASELLVFYVKTLSFSQEYLKFHQIPDEIIDLMETNVYSVLEKYLQHLMLGQVNVFKEQLLNLSKCLKLSETNHSYGFLMLFNLLLKIIANDNSDWSTIIYPIITEIFEALKQCRQELFWKPYNHGVYDTLIVNLTAAILVHDADCQCPELLIKYLLQNNPFISIFSLEVYTLLIRNISSQDCICLLINLLYSIEDLTIGYFTHRPEMVYLTHLLHRIFALLPDPLKEQILEIFPPDQHIQVWRFLGFRSVPKYKMKEIMQPVIDNTSASIKPAGPSFDENYIINMGEGLHLISTAKELNFHDESLKEIVTFLESFWTREFGDDVLDNNWFKYFIFKVDALTVICIQNNLLSSQLVFSKLKILAKNSSYWIPIFKIISLLLNSNLINKQDIIAQISDLLPLVMGKTIWLEENYLEMLLNLNTRDNETLNMLLDKLKPDIAQKVFEYIGSFKRKQDNINLVQAFELLGIASKFEHKCILWNKNLSVQDNVIPVQRNFKFDSAKANIPNKRRVTDAPVIHQSKTRKTETLSSIDNDDEDSCASEVISRLKGEVKCLVKVCYREKLTAKNCADLRLLMGQISSVIR